MLRLHLDLILDCSLVHDAHVRHEKLRTKLSSKTAQLSGFHSDNMMIEQGRGDNMQDTVDAIAQLATATSSDSGTLATLTATNDKLAYQLEAAQAYIKMLKGEILALKVNIKPAWQGQRPAKSTNNTN
jgi:hypothetical protein